MYTLQIRIYVSTHGGDQTLNIWISRSHDFLTIFSEIRTRKSLKRSNKLEISRFSRRSDLKYLDLEISRFSRSIFWVTGTPFTHVKARMKIWGLPWKRVWDVLEMCLRCTCLRCTANWLKILAVVIILSFRSPPSVDANTYMGWLRLVGSLKLQASFAKKPYKRDDILQKRRIILMSLLIIATPYSYSLEKKPLVFWSKASQIEFLNWLCGYTHRRKAPRNGFFVWLYEYTYSNKAPQIGFLVWFFEHTHKRKAPRNRFFTWLHEYIYRNKAQRIGLLEWSFEYWYRSTAPQIELLNWLYEYTYRRKAQRIGFFVWLYEYTYRSKATQIGFLNELYEYTHRRKAP